MNYEKNKAQPFINKRQGLVFIMYFCSSMLAIAIISMTIFYLYTSKDIGITYTQSLLTLDDLRNSILPGMIFTGGTVIIFTTVAVMIVTIVGSHKIAGPIFRLEKSLQAMGNGDLTVKVRFRKNDAIDRLAEDVNNATELFNAKISALSRRVAEIKEEARKLGERPDQSTGMLFEKIRLMKDEVSEFKTT